MRGEAGLGQVNVTISGKTFRMACDDGQEEHLEALGRQLSDTIELLREQFGEIGDQRLTVMAAITLADRHSEAERRLAQLEAEIGGIREARAALAERMEARDMEVAEAIETAAERLEGIAARLDGEDPLESA
jgi:cell division protein ZapA